MADVRILNAGTLIGFLPENEEAQAFFEDCIAAEGWQYLGPVLYVDHREALRIRDAMGDYGLTFE